MAESPTKPKKTAAPRRRNKTGATRPPTDSHDPSDTSEDSTGLTVAPLSTSVVDALLAVLLREAELRTARGDRELADDARMTAALWNWDVLDNVAAANALVANNHHPLAAGAILDLAICGAATPELLGVAQAAIATVTDPAQRGYASLELGKAWLLCADDPARAVELFAQASNAIGESGAIHSLIALAYSIAGDDESLVRDVVARATSGQADDPADLADAVAMLLDRRRDAAAALALASSGLAQFDAGAELVGHAAVHWLRIVDLAIEAASALADARLPGLLEQRQRRIAAHPIEANSYAALSEVAPHAYSDIVAIRLRLASQCSGEAAWIAAAHRWRALQCAQRIEMDATSLRALALAVHAVAASSESLRVIESAALREPGDAALDELITVLTSGDVECLLIAALLAEVRLADLARARQLYGLARASGAGTAITPQLRLLRRMRQQAPLAEAYRRFANAGSEPRARTAVLCAAGAIQLCEGHLRDAEQVFVQASAAHSVAADLSLALIYRRTERWQELADVLERVLPRLLDASVVADLTSERATILAQRLGDPVRALELVTAQLASSPNDSVANYLLTQLQRQVAGRLPTTLPPEAAFDNHAGVTLVDADGMMAVEAGVTSDDGVAFVDDAADDSTIARLAADGRWSQLAAALQWQLRGLPAEATSRQADLLIQLGEVRDQHLDLTDEAISSFESALERRPHDLRALAGLETIYRRSNRDVDLDRVIERRARATTDRHARSRAFRELAERLIARDDIATALTALTSAFSADSGDRELFSRLEQLAFQHGNWATALTLYDLALAAGGDQGNAYRRGDLLLRKGELQLRYLNQPAGAAATFTEIVSAENDYDEALAVLSEIAARRGDWTLVTSALERRADATTDIERASAALRTAVAIAVKHQLDTAIAVHLAQRIHTLNPRDEASLLALEELYEKSEAWPQLIDVLRRRLELTPHGDEHQRLVRRIAELSEERLRDGELATEHYLRLLEQDPDQRDAIDALARIYESTEQWAALIDITRRQLRVTTDRGLKALMYFKCGSVMEAKFGRPDDAIKYYEAALKTSPTCMPAVHGLRDLYRKRQAWPQVIATLEHEAKLWEDEKEQAGVLAQIGDVHKLLGDPERATKYFEHALQVDPDCVAATRALFEQQFEVGEWTRAVELADGLGDKAWRDGDPQARAELLRKRGIAASRKQDHAGAVQSMIEALDACPAYLPVLDALIDVIREHLDVVEVTTALRDLDRAYRKRDDQAAAWARVQIAQSYLATRNGDLDGAEMLLHAAVARVPTDLAVVLAHADFEASRRHWPAATAAIERFLALTMEPSPRGSRAAIVIELPTLQLMSSSTTEDRCIALRTLATYYGEGALDGNRALSTLAMLSVIAPHRAEVAVEQAHWQFAQGELPAALTSIDRAITLATVGESMAPAAELARMYAFLGGVLEKVGDNRAATQQYRRAREYDPSLANPALALAQRALESGDQRQAESLLIATAHAALAARGPMGAVPLQRALAQLLLRSGDRAAAIEAYRGILQVAGDFSDHVALAEIYSADNLPRAVAELRKVIAKNLNHEPTYRLLSALYERGGFPDRAARALEACRQLGFGDARDAAAAVRLRAQALTMSRPEPSQPAPVISDQTRVQRVAHPVTITPLGILCTAAAPQLSDRFPTPMLGERLVPLASVDRPAAFRAAEILRWWNVETELYVADRVPGLVAILAFPRRLIVVDRRLLAESSAVQRFVFGYAAEAIRSGYAWILALSERHRRELLTLLEELSTAAEDWSDVTRDFASRFPNAVEPLLTAVADEAIALDPLAWHDGAIAQMRRVGLLACDDIGVAAHAVALLAGELATPDSVPGREAIGTIGAAVAGADLMRYFLSDEFHGLRRPRAS